MDRLIEIPTRSSGQIDLSSAVQTRGVVKLRLGHAAWGSFAIIDAVFVKRGESKKKWFYFIPSFFGPPQLQFNIPEGSGIGAPHRLIMNADFSAPASDRALRVIIEILSNDQLKIYEDGAQLFRCRIRHKEPLKKHRSGFARCRSGRLELSVYHHTAPKTVPLIRQSGYIRGSPWNLQGIRKLTNICYPYFTTLKRIASDDDLKRIAMANNGTFYLKGMSSSGDPRVEMQVYRSNTSNRKATIRAWISVSSVSPNHLLRFQPKNDMAYYQVILPEIVRIGLKTGCVLKLHGDCGVVDRNTLHVFDYVICGDASTESGLEAPFDEENTREIVHLENLQDETIFDFWLKNSNSDQISFRSPEYRKLDPL